MLNIILGHDSALVKSFPVNTGVEFTEGEWAVFNASGKLVKQEGKLTAAQGRPFPVYGGNKVRFDAKALGVSDVLIGSSFYAETDKVEAVTIAPGDALTLNAGVLTKAGEGDVVVASAMSANVGGSLKFVRV